MPTFTTVDAAWIPSPATFDDAEARRFDTAMFLGDGTNNGVRGGIARHGDTSLAVTVNGSDQVSVQAGAFVIPAATGLGVYRGALQAAVGPTAGTALTARNATNPRIDLVVIQATSTGAVVKTIDGTPSSSPVAPALPAQHIELARLSVPAVAGGAVTVDSSFRAYATGLGGTLYIETSARLPGSGNQKGQRAAAIDTGLDYRWTGTAWQQQTNGYKLDAVPTLVNSTTSAGEGNNIYLRSGTVTLAMYLKAPAGGMASGQAVLQITSDFIPPRYLRTNVTSSSPAGTFPISIQTNGFVVLESALGANGLLYGTVNYAV